MRFLCIGNSIKRKGKKKVKKKKKCEATKTEKGYTSILSNNIYKIGERQPDFLAIWIWSNVLIEKFKGTEHAFFDGITRSLPEAHVFTTALEFYNRKAYVIHLNVSREWSETRLLARGRMDDKTKSDIDKRLDWFLADTVPAIEYYRHNPLYTVLDINGEQSIEDVQKEIVEKLQW